MEFASVLHTSVETALNSRCASDHDGDPLKGHWGMADPGSSVPSEALQTLEQAVRIPRFTQARLDVDFNQRPIVFAVSGDETGTTRQWANIESGMQQEAVHLTCAALGLGTCIYNMGVNGRTLDSGLTGTTSMALEMMHPSFDGKLWSIKGPEGWATGESLSDPDRAGDMPLLDAMEGMAVSAPGRAANWTDISQLLWAARGRTPHAIFGEIRGLTIPTWAGIQNLASVYLISQDGSFRYVNDLDGRPYHAIERIDDKIDGLEDGTVQIVLTSDEDTGRSLWEVGYMLENLFVQAVSLAVEYEAQLLDRTAITEYAAVGILDASAVFTVPVA